MNTLFINLKSGTYGILVHNQDISNRSVDISLDLMLVLRILKKGNEHISH